MKADLIITGTIFTGTRQKASPEAITGIAEAVAVKDGRICYVGDSKQVEKLLDTNTIQIKLENSCVMPGVIEGHAHATAGIVMFQGVDLYEKETVKEYMEVIDQYIQTHPEKKYIMGRGYINSRFGQEGPSAAWLDQKYPNHYFYIESEDCHSCVVNRKVLELAGINKDTMDFENGVIVRDIHSGEPTGWLKETEMERVKKLFPETSLEDYKQTILKYQDMALKNGIVASYEPIFDMEGDYEKRIEAYRQLDMENLLVLDFRVGITVNPGQSPEIIDKITSLKENVNGSHFQIIGIKIFIDGVIEGHTAFLREPYADMPEDCGESMWHQNDLNCIIREAAKKDLSVHIHAIGDGALDVALNGYEAAWDINRDKDLRNCITHLQIVQPDQIEKFKEMNIIAVTNPYWHFRNPAYFDELEIPYLGMERASLEYPMKSFLNKGVIVTQASDWPVSYSNYPFIGMEIAVTRKALGNKDMKMQNEKEALTPEEMILVMCANGSYQLKLEDEIGTIEIGKKGNFIILDKDPCKVPTNQIGQIKIISHYINGINVLK